MQPVLLPDLTQSSQSQLPQGENDRLRQALEKLQHSISLMQTEFESSLAVAEDNFHRQLEQQRAELVSQQQPAAIPLPSPAPRDEHEESPSGSPLAVSVFTPKCRVGERFIEGLGGLTPVVRPVSDVGELLLKYSPVQF
jgi:hypothetical protein